MADPIHDDGGAAGGADDDFDLSAEDHSQDSDTDLDSPGASTDGDNADDNRTSTDDDSGKTDDSDSPAFDADLDEWAEKTGRGKPETDRERKLMQDIRNGQRDYSRARAPKKTADDIAKVIDGAKPKSRDPDPAADPLEVKYNQLESDLRMERDTRLRAEYVTENNVTTEEAEVMGQILKEKADRGDMRTFEALADARNMGDLHDLAKMRMAKGAPADSADVVAKAKQEERDRLAKISKAGGPSRSAKSTTPAAKKDELTALWESDD